MTELYKGYTTLKSTDILGSRRVRLGLGPNKDACYMVHYEGPEVQYGECAVYLGSSLDEANKAFERTIKFYSNKD